MKKVLYYLSYFQGFIWFVLLNYYNYRYDYFNVSWTDMLVAFSIISIPSLKNMISKYKFKYNSLIFYIVLNIVLIIFNYLVINALLLRHNDPVNGLIYIYPLELFVCLLIFFFFSRFMQKEEVLNEKGNMYNYLLITLTSIIYFLSFMYNLFYNIYYLIILCISLILIVLLIEKKEISYNKLFTIYVLLIILSLLCKDLGVLILTLSMFIKIDFMAKKI